MLNEYPKETMPRIFDYKTKEEIETFDFDNDFDKFAEAYKGLGQVQWADAARIGSFRHSCPAFRRLLTCSCSPVAAPNRPLLGGPRNDCEPER